jgi:hypothetical protein
MTQIMEQGSHNSFRRLIGVFCQGSTLQGMIELANGLLTVPSGGAAA